MKVTGKACRSQVIEGTISASELLALVRETFAIPEKAAATFHVVDSGSMTGIRVQLGCTASPVVQVTDGTPVHFRVTWELPLAEQG